MSLLELFCAVDDFCEAFEPQWQQQLLTAGEWRRRTSGLCLSEVITLMIHFHQSRYRHFKSYYQNYVRVYLCQAFPELVSYGRFVELMQRAVVPLAVYLRCRFGRCTGISFVDSTALAVCRNQRIHQHKVFLGLAARGKTSMGWFYGFKLHLVVNEQGELLACQLTPGNTAGAPWARKPVPTLAQRLFGKLFGDKGYLSQPLVEALMTEHKVHLITAARRNMQDRLLIHADAVLLRKRALVESIYDQLKNISQIEHSRHRSPINFVVNLLAGLIAYSFQEKKPSLHLDPLLVPAIS
jgi:hypothetical protein